MNSIDQQLFETYGETTLNEMGHGFDEKQLEKWLETFSIHEKARYRVVDGLLDYYYDWASAAFSIGLRLGLSLLNDDIRRPRAEQG